MSWPGSLRLRVLLSSCVVALGSALPAGGLQPPDPGAIQRYKADGTFNQRLAEARRLGNHRTDPRLAGRLRERLRREHLKATGTPAPDDGAQGFAPPTSWQGGLPATGTPKVLVLLVDFPDYPAAGLQTAADVQSKFFGGGNAGLYPYESLRNFYQRSSYGQLTIGGNVLGWYRAPNNRSDYETPGSGQSREALIMEILNYYNAQGHDFTQYDNDGNGKIDAFFIKWTGPDNGWANFWWAYQTSWYANPGYRIDGKSLGKYVWSWISRPEGRAYEPRTDIHETGHLLGLPDLYDYDAEVGPHGGVGDLDMMDANWGDHNCFSKFMLEWLTPTTITSGQQTVSLNRSGDNPSCVLIMPNVTPGYPFDEFFMVQYRVRSVGNDPSNYPNDGLLIWHVDAALNSYGSDFLYDNSYTEHKLVRLMEADGLEEIEQNGQADSGDYYRIPKTFGMSTTPSSRNYAGAHTGVTVDQLSTPATTMSARFSILEHPIITAVGSAVVWQSCPSDPNLDPQETVKVSFSLRNTGVVDTANMMATLQASGGVTYPSAAQSYGVLTADGPAVSRVFTFTVSGACAGTVTATLLPYDGVHVFDPVTFTLPIGNLLSPLAEDFDALSAPALPAGWTAVVAAGTVEPWATSTASVYSPPNAAFASGPQTVSDNRLESPSIAINTSATQLTFRHRYVLENNYDGGVLEIAIGAGGFTDILAAGGSFVSGGYTHTISTSYGNPLGGRSAWSGNSNTFVTTAVNLPSAAVGQNIRLRWRLGTDSSVSGTGWYVDSILLAEGFACCSGPNPDLDHDTDVDSADYNLIQACGFAPDVAYPAGCDNRDFDGDSDVDLADFGLLQRCFSGSGTSFDTLCLE